jgi:hypothetical protein
VSPDPITLIPQCPECGALWQPDAGERWSAFHTDDEPPELVFYCPDCAEREFDE